MLKLENSIRGLSFSGVAFDLTIQDTKKPLNDVCIKRSFIYTGIPTNDNYLYALILT